MKMFDMFFIIASCEKYFSFTAKFAGKSFSFYRADEKDVNEDDFS